MELQVEKIEPKVNEVLAVLPAYQKIETIDQAKEINEFLGQIVNIRKELKDFCQPSIDDAYLKHRKRLEIYRKLDSKPLQIENQFRRMLTDWTLEQRRIQENEQRKADEQAKKDAIKEAKKSGDEKLAKAIQDDKVAVISEKTPAPVEKLGGFSSRMNYVAEVIDLMALVRAIAQNKQSISYIQANMTVLNATARSHKGKITIPGIQIREVPVTVKRG
jgi:hypothetical protein